MSAKYWCDGCDRFAYAVAGAGTLPNCAWCGRPMLPPDFIRHPLQYDRPEIVLLDVFETLGTTFYEPPFPTLLMFLATLSGLEVRLIPCRSREGARYSFRVFTTTWLSTMDWWAGEHTSRTLVKNWEDLRDRITFWRRNVR